MTASTPGGDQLSPAKLEQLYKELRWLLGSYGAQPVAVGVSYPHGSNSKWPPKMKRIDVTVVTTTSRAVKQEVYSVGFDGPDHPPDGPWGSPWSDDSWGRFLYGDGTEEE